MQIKRNVSFKLRPYGTKRTVYQIQMHVSFNSQRLRFSTGCQLSTLDAWDEEKQLVSPGYIGPKGETDLSINNILRDKKDQIETVFKYFEVTETLPTSDQVNERYLGRIKGERTLNPETLNKKRQAKSLHVLTVFESFVSECGEKNAWTDATYEKMSALKEDLSSFMKDVKFSDLDESGLTSFVRYLRDEKILKTVSNSKMVQD